MKRWPALALAICPGGLRSDEASRRGRCSPVSARENPGPRHWRSPLAERFVSRREWLGGRRTRPRARCGSITRASTKGLHALDGFARSTGALFFTDGFVNDAVLPRDFDAATEGTPASSSRTWIPRRRTSGQGIPRSRNTSPPSMPLGARSAGDRTSPGSASRGRREQCHRTSGLGAPAIEASTPTSVRPRPNSSTAARSTSWSNSPLSIRLGMSPGSPCSRLLVARPSSFHCGTSFARCLRRT